MSTLKMNEDGRYDVSFTLRNVTLEEAFAKYCEARDIYLVPCAGCPLRVVSQEMLEGRQAKNIQRPLRQYAYCQHLVRDHPDVFLFLTDSHTQEVEYYGEETD